MNFKEKLRAKTEELKQLAVLGDALNEEQRAQMTSLRDEVNNLRAIVSADAVQRSTTPEEALAAEAEQLRSVMTKAKARAGMEFTLYDNERAAGPTKTSDVEVTTPLIFQRVLSALQPKLVIHKLGIEMQTGVRGVPTFPIISDVEANVLGEDEAIVDQKINLSKLDTRGTRAGVGASITAQAVNMNSLKLLTIIPDKMGQAAARLLNKRMFALTQPTAPNDTMRSVLAEPYASAATYTAAAGIKWSDCVELESKVLDADVELGDGTVCYLMNPRTYGKLKSSVKEKGDAEMIITKEGTLNGYPVVVTNFMPADCILFGDFQYVVVSQYGDNERFSSEYKGDKDKYVFYLNTDYSVIVLRPEAFACLKKA